MNSDEIKEAVLELVDLHSRDLSQYDYQRLMDELSDEFTDRFNAMQEEQ